MKQYKFLEDFANWKAGDIESGELYTVDIGISAGQKFVRFKDWKGETRIVSPSILEELTNADLFTEKSFLIVVSAFVLVIFLIIKFK